jgi:hypothetical protein
MEGGTLVEAKLFITKPLEVVVQAFPLVEGVHLSAISLIVEFF